MLLMPKPQFLDLHLSISKEFVVSKIYKRNGFDFDIVNFPFLDGDVPLTVITFLNLFDLLECLVM